MLYHLYFNYKSLMLGSRGGHCVIVSSFYRPVLQVNYIDF